MSDYHVLSADEFGNRFTVVMHFPVANQDNEVGYGYRIAIVEWQGGAPIQSALPNPGVEQAQLDAGELYERMYSFNSNPNETLAEKQARLDMMYAENKTDAQGRIVKILGFWGHSRTVP
jgi:hypothetical protein